MVHEPADVTMFVPCMSKYNSSDGDVNRFGCNRTESTDTNLLATDVSAITEILAFEDLLNVKSPSDTHEPPLAC
jgi:hypothetical protein